MNKDQKSSPEARHQLAALLRRFYSGRITNWQFEDQAERFLIADTAAAEVFHYGPWTTYSDVPEHKFTDHAFLRKEDRQVIARWILFLKSGQDYRWPPSRPLKEWIAPLLLMSGIPIAWWANCWEFTAAGMFLLFWAANFHNRLEYRRIFRAGDKNYWPFLRETDFAKAKRRPPYLKGTNFTP